MVVESFAETEKGVGIERQERANCQWYDGVESLRGTFRISSLTTPTDEFVRLSASNHSDLPTVGM